MVLGLLFPLIIDGVSLSMLKYMEKLEPVGWKRENLKAMPLLTRCLVKSMHWEKREDFISLLVFTGMAPDMFTLFLNQFD